MKKKTVRKELEEIAPFLADLKAKSKGNEASVPEGYFENFRTEFFDKVKQPEVSSTKKEPKVIRMNWRYIAVAASVAIIVIAFWFSNTLILNNDADSGIADLSIDEMYDYLGEHIEEFEMDELASIVTDNEMDDFGILEIEEDFIDEEYFEDEILDDFDYEDLL